jgi:hypothetical protein
MDSKTIFVVTPKGEAEIKKQTSLLSGDVKRALILLDNKSTVKELSRRAAPSLRAMLQDMLQELLSGGFIQDQSWISQAPRMVIPRMATPEQDGDLDFTSMSGAPAVQKPAVTNHSPHFSQPQNNPVLPSQIQQSQPRQTIAHEHQAEMERATQQADAARLRAEQEAALVREELETTQNRAEAETRMRAKIEEQAKELAETIRLNAETAAADTRAAAEAVRLLAQQEAQKARTEAEAARADAERARAELENVRARADEETARYQAEHAAAAAVKLLQEAETARINTEHAEARRKAEHDLARVNADAQQLALKDAALWREAEQAAIQQRAEADAARFKAEQDALQAREDAEAAQLEAERMRAELTAANTRAAEEEEQRQAAQALAAELKLAQVAADARTSAKREAALREAEHERARIQAEAEQKMRAEAAAFKLKAEQEAAQLRQETQALQQKAAEDAEAARASAKHEAEVARAKAAQETEVARAQAEQAAAAAQAWAEQQAAQIKADAQQQLDAARRKAEQEIQRVQTEIAEARLLAEQETARVQSRLEAAQAGAEADADAKRMAEEARDQAQQEIARLRAVALVQAQEEEAPGRVVAEFEHEATLARSTTAAVVCFGIADITQEKLPRQIKLKAQFDELVSRLLPDLDHNKHIKLDIAEGTALAFLQHPEHALEMALKLRDALVINPQVAANPFIPGDLPYPELRIKTGIHLGPVDAAHDRQAGRFTGDALVGAQLIMGFAALDSIFISRSYYDLILRQQPEFSGMLHYHGTEKDSHGRTHQIYEVTGQREEFTVQHDEPDIQLAPFALDLEQPPPVEDPHNAASATLHNTPGEAAITTAPSPVMQQAAADEHSSYTVPPQPDEQKSAAEIAAEAQALARYEAQQVAQAEQLKATREAAKARAEQEARRLAEEQARLWNEAEQRAQAQAAAETAARAATQAQRGAPGDIPSARPQRVAKVRRNPLPWGKMAAAIVVLIVALAFVLPYVWPTQGMIAQIEKILSAQLQQPVHIAQLKAALLPAPKLQLLNITIGRSEEFKAAEVVLNFDPAGLLSESKPIDSVAINDLVLSAAALEKVLPWLQAVGSNTHFPVAQLAVARARINSDGLDLPVMYGTAQWDRPGHLSRAALHSADSKLKLDLLPQPSGWKATLQVKESALPLLPQIQFNELHAEIALSEGSAVFDQIQGRLYGGELSGNARLDWKQGWRMQGRLAVKELDLQAALPLYNLAGLLKGDGTFNLNAATLAQLGDTPQLNGSFTVSKGVINKIDLVETASQGNRQSGASGRTHYDELSGVLQMANHSQQLRQLRMTGGVMSASGSVDVSAEQKLSGRLAVNLKMRSGFGSVPLVLSGTLTEPVLHTAR